MLGFSIFFYIYLVILTLLTGIVLTGIVVVSSDKRQKEGCVHKLISAFVSNLFGINKGWRITFQGLEKMPLNSPYIIVANHQSVIDPFIFFKLPVECKLVAKEWVTKVPIIGYGFSQSGQIMVEQGITLEKAKTKLDRGLPVVFFPEGTRSSDGDIGPFLKGAFELSATLNLPIQPIVVDGTRSIIPKHSKLFCNKADIKIHVLDLVYPADFNNDSEKLRSHIHSLMQETLNELRTNEAPRLVAQSSSDQAFQQ